MWGRCRRNYVEPGIEVMVGQQQMLVEVPVEAASAEAR
jgi:hypothetical protein